MRTPIIDELYSSQSIATKASATSRDLLPERNNSFNLGVSQEFYDVWSSGGYSHYLGIRFLQSRYRSRHPTIW
ncbi:MAG: hypothetical protein PGN22_16500 [Agrobacterium cavarae]